MKHLCIFLCAASLFISCKTEKKEGQIPVEVTSTVTKAPTTAEKIARAHGFDNWKNINRITFEFNVTREGKQGNGRLWTWFPKKDSIVMTTSEKQVAYNRKRLDSISTNTDRAFINDKFWLLVPFQLVWDEGTTISESVKAVAPISKSEMNKITLTYGNEGGYTPGDAYDIFFDENHLIREWVFRQGNAAEPTMTTTFENYEDFKGLKIAKDHKMADGDFNLFFSDISVK